MKKKETNTNPDILLIGRDNVETTRDFRSDDGPTCCAQRWVLAYMGMWLGIMTYMLNSNMSIAVVCMVKTESDNTGDQNTTLYETNDSVSRQDRTLDNTVLTIQNVSLKSEYSKSRCDASVNTLSYISERAEFDWDKKTLSFVLSGYFYGYMVTQIPGGWLTSVFGGKHVISTFMVTSSAITLLIPVLARTSVYLLILARALIGMCVGTVIPGYCGLVGIWALPTERSRFMAFLLFGQMVGVMLGYSTSGLLCVHGFDNGWPSIFYVHGSTGAVFVLAWLYLIHASPRKHPRITEMEKQLLLKHSHAQATSHKEKKHVPWKKVFTYLPVYAVFITHASDNWTHYLILTCLPQFFKEVLKLNIQSNGLLSCLPFLTFMIGIAFAGICADFIRKKNYFTVTKIRKIFQITGLMGVAVFILIPGFLTCDQKGVAIMCLCLCTLFEGIGITGGFSCNAIDIAPRYASVIFAVSNTIASVPGIIAPLVVAEITKNQTNDEWRVVFYMCTGVSVCAAFIYGVLGNSELAPWSDIYMDNEMEDNKSSRSNAINGDHMIPMTEKEILNES